ncbi:uncharacterized protein K441DRAFT_697937 [Cenococcum geophilum 1.58]|uniref:uncharacterized protein n=1 Tax=Cenococcum geophilum 1.58 TaxID=794803 RepID=UPI00358E5D86|nr:hypothetical protein K441DRAFT_697937 [Cenococcum geophilum 1.58]
MGTTTLVTFLFESPAAARTVELLGSWDNFAKSYPMKRDLRKGSCFWSGCYSFKDIICDGDLNNLGQKRSGGLKMGGTYWYYYRIDGNEYHDSTQPSTTFCPLLPGQRLNVLEVPFESRSRSNSASSISSGIHTLDPEDKYLTPRPAPIPRLPKPSGSRSYEHFRKHSHPGIGDSTITVTSHPLSANNDSKLQLRLGSSHERKIKSAASSTSSTLKTAFLDLTGTNEKSATSLDTSKFRRPASAENERGRSRHARNVRELQISPPILIGSTSERRNLIPLKTNGFPNPSLSSPISQMAVKGHGFSPLRCHPVDAEIDLSFSNESIQGVQPPVKRDQSQTSLSSIRLEFVLGRERTSSVGRKRTNSPRRARSPSRSETIYHRRSLSIGRVREPSPLRHAVIFDEPMQIPEEIKEVKNEDEAAAEVAQPSLSPLVPSHSIDTQRPPSCQKDDLDPAKQSKPLLDKDLPALPSYLVPEPLFCQVETSEVDGANLMKDEQMTQTELSSNISLWANTSAAPTSPSLDGDGVNSPTFSCLTTSSSDIDTPERLSDQFATGIDIFYHVDGEGRENEHLNDPCDRHESAAAESHKLLESPLGPDFFKIDIKRPESAPRRHAACFGLLDRFHGYSLPDDQSASDGARAKPPTMLSNFGNSIPSESQINAEADPAVSQLEHLMSEFGYLGEAVL